MRELDRLRAELAETRAELHGATGAAAVLRERGDALADAKNWVEHVVEAERWRSVRGDAPAPAEPPADPEPTRWSTLDDAMRVAHERPLIAACTWHSRSECVCPVHDVVTRLSDAGMLRDAAPAATPEPPAVELPVTLSSVDDVAAVRRNPVWQDGYTTGFADAARFDSDASNAPDLVVGKAGVPIDAYDAIQILATRPDHPSRLLAEKARAVADWWNDPPGGLWQREQLDEVAADLGELLGDLLGGGPGDVSDVRPAGQPVRDGHTSGEESTS
nr:hypothetical protein [Pseudonocardia sp. AL041005-10]